jgi:hypothetical protein
VLIVTLDSHGSSSVLDDPVVRNFQGSVLVVPPKWTTIMDERRLGWVRKGGLRRIPTDDWFALRVDGEPEAPQTNGETEFDKAIEQERTRRNSVREAVEAARKAGEPQDMLLAAAPGRGRHSLRVVNPPSDLAVSSLTAQTGAIERFRTFRRAPGWRPVIVDETGGGVLIEAENAGGLFVLSDPDLMNTQGLADIDNARALVHILDTTFGPGTAYVFDVSMHGFARSRSFLRVAFEPPFLAATLVAIATALLMGWHAFVRFGRAREEGRAFALGKRALADNQADLIKMANREHRMGAPYGALIRDLAARAAGAPRDMPPDALDDFMDRLGEGGRTSWPLSVLRRDIEHAKDPADLVKAAGRLHHWKLEMTRERQ